MTRQYTATVNTNSGGVVIETGPFNGYGVGSLTVHTTLVEADLNDHDQIRAEVFNRIFDETGHGDNEVKFVDQEGNEL